MKERTIGIIGKSNTGKTRNILFNEVEEQINGNKNLLIVDENGEYYNHFGEKLINNGYTLKVVNFNNPLKSNGWDPLEYIYYLYSNKKTDRAIELIQNMGEEIFKNNGESDPFWTNMATSFFIGVVLILMKAREEGDTSALKFYSTISLIRQYEQIGDASFLEKYDTMDPIYIALSPIVFAPVETRESILSIVKQRLNLFFTRPQLLQSFTNNDFKVSSLIEEEKVAVFVIGYKPINRLTNILIEQCFNVVNDYDKEITFIIDGIDELPPIDLIDEMIKLANRGKMSLMGTIRDMKVISEKYNSLIAFRNIEKVIKLEEKVEIEFDNNSFSLPDLGDRELERFDFEKYVK